MTRSSGVHVREYEDQYICLHDGVELDGPVTVWEDYEAMTWGYTCHCGKPIEHDILNPAERGASAVAVIVFAAGLLTASLAFFAPAPASWVFFLIGVAVAVLVVYLAAVGWLNRNGMNQ